MDLCNLLLRRGRRLRYRSRNAVLVENERDLLVKHEYERGTGSRNKIRVSPVSLRMILFFVSRIKVLASLLIRDMINKFYPATYVCFV